MSAIGRSGTPLVASDGGPVAARDMLGGLRGARSGVADDPRVELPPPGRLGDRCITTFETHVQTRDPLDMFRLAPDLMPWPWIS